MSACFRSGTCLSGDRFKAYRAVFVGPELQTLVVRRLKLYIIVSELLTASTFLEILGPFVAQADKSQQADSPNPAEKGQVGMPLSSRAWLYYQMRAWCSISFVLSLLCICAAFCLIAIVTNRSPRQCQTIFSHSSVDDQQNHYEQLMERQAILLAANSSPELDNELKEIGRQIMTIQRVR